MESRDVCAGCGSVGWKFKWCARCRRVKYCSEGCQKEDWPHHKLVCDPTILGAITKRNRTAKIIRANHDFVGFATAMGHFARAKGEVGLRCEIKPADSGENHYLCDFESLTSYDQAPFAQLSKDGKFPVLIRQVIDGVVDYFGFRFEIAVCKLAFEVLEAHELGWIVDIPTRGVIIGSDAFIIRRDDGTTITSSSGKIVVSRPP